MYICIRKYESFVLLSFMCHVTGASNVILIEIIHSATLLILGSSLLETCQSPQHFSLPYICSIIHYGNINKDTTICQYICVSVTT